MSDRAEQIREALRGLHDYRATLSHPMYRERIKQAASDYADLLAGIDYEAAVRTHREWSDRIADGDPAADGMGELEVMEMAVDAALKGATE